MLYVVSRCFILSYDLLLGIPLRSFYYYDLWCVIMCQNMLVLSHIVLCVCALCYVCL